MCPCVFARACVCVHFRIAGHSTAPKGESQYGGKRRWVGEWVGDGVGWVRGGGGKAKVYESKGTPNYSYTIHD